MTRVGFKGSNCVFNTAQTGWMARVMVWRKHLRISSRSHSPLLTNLARWHG